MSPMQKIASQQKSACSVNYDFSAGPQRGRRYNPETADRFFESESEWPQIDIAFMRSRPLSR